jgi:hypothetical protein
MRHGIRVSGALTIVTLSILATATVTAAASAAQPAASTSHAASTTASDSPMSALAPKSIQDDDDGTLLVKEMPKGGINLLELAPGDRTQWAAEVTNNGDPGMLNVEFFADGHQDLMSGGDSSLRITVDLCADPLTAVVSDTGVVTFDCESGLHRLGTVTSATEQHLQTARTFRTGNTIGVRVLVTFPSSADNASENTAASMNVMFSISPQDGGTSTSIPSSPGNGAGADSGTGNDGATPNSAQRGLPGGLALTGTNAMFMSFAASAIIALGILLLSLVPRRTRTEGDEAS